MNHDQAQLDLAYTQCVAAEIKLQRLLLKRKAEETEAKKTGGKS